MLFKVKSAAPVMASTHPGWVKANVASPQKDPPTAIDVPLKYPQHENYVGSMREHLNLLYCIMLELYLVIVPESRVFGISIPRNSYRAGKVYKTTLPSQSQ